MSKAVHGKNKIVRNRTEESVPSEAEMEVVRFDGKEQTCKGAGEKEVGRKSEDKIRRDK